MQHSDTDAGPRVAPFDPSSISRPHKSLMKYYVLIALLSGPAFPFVLLPLFFKYETLRYRFDAEGIAMTWGILFRREIYLTYRRIQDIHLTRNILQRWMGLATVSVQTASGSAMPEMSIDGILQAAELRDFLYAKMRGGHGETPVAAPSDTSPQPASDDEVLPILCDIRDSLRQLVSRGGAR